MAGVLTLLSTAVLRLSPRILELGEYRFGPEHWALLLVFVPWMAWAEGIRGFHRAFAPRVVARACYLKSGHHPVLWVLAPLFCMGYIHATTKRKIVSWSVTGIIVGLVLLLSITPQPWRGIIDAGVVTGLAMGIVSLLYFAARSLAGKAQTYPLDLPEISVAPAAAGDAR